MSAELVWIIASQIILVINVITIHVALRRRYSLRFSVGMLVLLDVVFTALILLTGLTAATLRGITGFVFLPLVVWLFRELLFQKVFAVFLVLQLTVGISWIAVDFSGLFKHYGENPAFQLLIIVIFMAVYCFFLFRFGRGILSKLFEHGHQAEFSLYSLGAVFSYAAMYYIDAKLSGIEHALLLLFILWGFAILCFAIINTHEKAKKSAEAEFAQKIVSAGREHYHIMNEMYETLSVMRHDYKYHLSAARDMLRSGDTAEAEKYLAEVERQTPELRRYCTNPVINALLSNYAERFEKLYIRFDVSLDMPGTLSVSNYDMCIIFGNLLENAAEACLTLARGRKIELAVEQNMMQLLIMVRNGFDGVIEAIDGQPVSSKTDGGFGLRSVRAVAARYGGHLLTKWDRDTFTAYVAVAK